MDETGIYSGNSLAGIKNIPVREKYATDNLVVRNIFLTHAHTHNADALIIKKMLKNKLFHFRITEAFPIFNILTALPCQQEQ